MYGSQVLFALAWLVCWVSVFTTAVATGLQRDCYSESVLLDYAAADEKRSGLLPCISTEIKLCANNLQHIDDAVHNFRPVNQRSIDDGDCLAQFEAQGK